MVDSSGPEGEVPQHNPYLSDGLDRAQGPQILILIKCTPILWYALNIQLQCPCKLIKLILKVGVILDVGAESDAILEMLKKKKKKKIEHSRWCIAIIVIQINLQVL